MANLRVLFMFPHLAIIKNKLSFCGYFHFIFPPCFIHFPRDWSQWIRCETKAFYLHIFRALNAVLCWGLSKLDLNLNIYFYWLLFFCMPTQICIFWMFTRASSLFARFENVINTYSLGQMHCYSRCFSRFLFIFCYLLAVV